MLFHTIDEVFHPRCDGNPSLHQEPISYKKLGKRHAHWGTRKVVLGWIIDTVQATIELPPWRLHNILAFLPCTKKCIAVRQWHKILGELRSMTLAVPDLGVSSASFKKRFLT